MTKTLSLVVPIYNDGSLAQAFCVEMQRVMEGYLGSRDLSSQIEVIFVDDGSANHSVQLLQQCCQQFSFAKYIELSRNFGQHVAISCGYLHATGEYVGMLNVDMEDPPDQIPLLLDVIRQKKCDLVLSIRSSRKVGWSEQISSVSFNWVLNKLTRSNIPLNVGTLRLMNQTFLAAYNSFQEKSRFLPGLENWLGFKVEYVSIRNSERTQGKSSYSFLKRLKMAAASVISFSDFPLKIVATGGLILANVGFLLTAALVIGKLFFVDFRPGYTSTVALIVCFGGLQIFVIGLASLYIGRILTEVQGRPLFVIRSKGNFE